jgi:hypothetical protein
MESQSAFFFSTVFMSLGDENPLHDAYAIRSGFVPANDMTYGFPSML